jgi:hypothetical protein
VEIARVSSSSKVSFSANRCSPSLQADLCTGHVVAQLRNGVYFLEKTADRMAYRSLNIHPAVLAKISNQRHASQKLTRSDVGPQQWGPTKK